MLGCLDGRDQEFFDLDTLLQDSPVPVIAAFDQQFQPVLAFRALLQGDLKFGDEIRPPVGIERLPNVGPDTCSGAEELIGQHRFTLCTLDVIAHPDDLQGKGLGFAE